MSAAAAAFVGWLWNVQTFDIGLLALVGSHLRKRIRVFVKYPPYSKAPALGNNR